MRPLAKAALAVAATALVLWAYFFLFQAQLSPQEKKLNSILSDSGISMAMMPVVESSMSLDETQAKSLAAKLESYSESENGGWAQAAKTMAEGVSLGQSTGAFTLSSLEIEPAFSADAEPDALCNEIPLMEKMVAQAKSASGHGANFSAEKALLDSAYPEISARLNILGDESIPLFVDDERVSRLEEMLAEMNLACAPVADGGVA